MISHHSVEQELYRTGTMVFGTVGNSMKPLLSQGKTAVVVKAYSGDGSEKLKCGDVVLFRRGEKLIFHRIVQIENGGYGVCGDNRWRVEHGVTEDRILGVMTAYIKEGIEIPVTDAEYLEYVDGILRTRKNREFQGRIKQIKRIVEKFLPRRMQH